MMSNAKLAVVKFVFVLALAIFGLLLATKVALAADKLISAGFEFKPDEYIASGNDKYALKFQGDGNLVLYKVGKPFVPLWDSKTCGSGANRCIFQTDGNLVVYKGEQAFWASGTDGHPDARLMVQDDGNLVIYVGPVLCVIF